jgi:NhaP-type Na+/H+ or K+/H+ antiporter
MALFELTLALLLGAVILAALARRLEVPYPALLALAGAGVAFLPFAPVIEIEPELALALFVAPVLVDAAFDTSPRDLERYALPLTLLALVAVILTTAAVALVGWRMAGLPIAAAIAPRRDRCTAGRGGRRARPIPPATPHHGHSAGRKPAQ